VAAADLTEVVAWREARKSAFEIAKLAPLTFTVLFVHALARQLTPPADIGVAVALDAGLIVPVLRQADGLSLGETARQHLPPSPRVLARVSSDSKTRRAPR
jgi:pyruvate/2-oxoglutarate dehydrogenase complex dihydrolipoamide acyltransferase (E2) component